MTPEEFIMSINFTQTLTQKEREIYFESMLSHIGYVKAMEEYADYVLSIAAEKAETTIEEVSDDYCKIDQYEKISDGYGLEILTNASKWFDDDSNVYVD